MILLFCLAHAAEVVDLTHPLAGGIPTFPGGTPFAAHTLGTVEHDGYYIRSFTTGEHTGTHVDAPGHFVAKKATVEQIPAGELVGRAAVVDVTEKVSRNVDYAVTVDDLRAWEQRHGPLGAGTIVVVRTGWGQRWSDPAAYLNRDAKGDMHFPGVSEEAARYALGKGVRGIGIDTLSTDIGPSATFAEHKAFHAGGGWHVENLANLERLPEAGATIVVAPLPIAQGSGAPARVLALLP